MKKGPAVPIPGGFFFLSIAVLVLILWFSWFSYYSNSEDSESKVSGGTFGDAFGSLNALFTGLALIGVSYSIFAQHRESRERKKEFDQERADHQAELTVEKVLREESEQRITVRHLNDQRTTQRLEQRRSFEDHFFQLMESFNERVSNFTSTEHSKRAQGYESFGLMMQIQNRAALDISESENLIAMAEERYSQTVYRLNDSQLSAYMRMLYQLYKHVDNAPFAGKELYADTLRAGLTGDELAILALNGLTDHAKKFLPLYRKHAILKHLPKDAFQFEKTYLALRAHYGEECFVDLDDRPTLSPSKSTANATVGSIVDGIYIDQLKSEKNAHYWRELRKRYKNTKEGSSKKEDS